MVVSHFRDVYKAFYITLLQPCKCAKYCEACDGGIDDLSLAVCLDLNKPGIGLGASEAEGDAPRFVIDFEDMNLKVLPRLNDLRGVCDGLPCEFRDVDETIRAAKIDERSEITDAGDTALADGSLLQFRQQGLSLLDRACPGMRRVQKGWRVVGGG